MKRNPKTSSVRAKVVRPRRTEAGPKWVEARAGDDAAAEYWKKSGPD